MQKIIVPASSANLGPGFDSLGLAVDRYLTLEVLEKMPNWQIEHDLGPEVSHDETNLVIKSALTLDKDLTPHRIKMNSEIPLARGLGSSSAAIVAGLKLAQVLSAKQFSDQELLEVATKLEGHPDNVAPALFGGLTISLMVNERPQTIKATFPEIGLLAYIPDFELETKVSRSVLPERLEYATAVRAGSGGNALVAALLTDDLELVAELIEQDGYHEPYREKLVPHLKILRELGHKVEAKGTYLSGAGPTVMTLIAPEKMASFIKAAREHGLTGEFTQLAVDQKGARSEEI
ncbi:homoserine kinase [Ligilactobacillus animalis]|uniref:homoserine kinase n=1 Tax=Ligilactobacillus animalis TaxID=1605 RepID=UPI00021958E0|nr:homoserine kinase [Ligilactobacillus animalis]KRM60103.1 homoserine kinase [Ligilactobacillus animalis KCTC 3501 = DSM 20602]